MRLAPSAVVVVCWFIIQNNIEAVTGSGRPFLLLAVLGAFYVMVPLCPYAGRLGRSMPRDFLVALVVSLLGLVYTMLALAAMAFWSGFSLG